MNAVLRLMLALVVAAAALVPPAHAQSRPAPSDQEILIALERDWDRAFFQGDAAFIERVLADEFVAIYPDGTRGDKARELSEVAAFNQQVESSTLDDFAVKVSADLAVVRFTRTLVGPVQGVRTEITYRFIDVFVWRDNRWQCIVSQSTKVVAP